MQTRRADAVYASIYNYFVSCIDNGQMQPHDRLPPVTALREDWGVTGPTAMKAITCLRQEGYVYTNRQGCFVRAGGAARLLEKLVEILNELEDREQQLVLEENSTGACIVGRDGGVCWNTEAARWERVTD